MAQERALRVEMEERWLSAERAWLEERKARLREQQVRQGTKQRLREILENWVKGVDPVP
jgi:hypothetical protein